MSPDPSPPEPERDDELVAALAAVPLPLPPPALARRVRHRRRRRRLFQRVAVGLAAAGCLTLGVLAWQNRPQPEQVAYDVPEPAFLRAAPPVDTLDLLARQQ